MLRISGSDTLSFAHAQFSSDVRGLVIGKWHWSAWLTPKGRVTALFALYRPTEDKVLLILPDGEAAMMATQLQRYILRRKVQIAVERDLIATGTYDTPVQATGTQAAQLNEITELDVSGITLPRRLLLVPAAAVSRPAPAFEAQWRTTDLQLGLPRLDANQRAQWTPQQIGLDRLNAYSVRKGCYPGQEIVARTHFLGKAKRRAQLLSITTPVQPGETVKSAGVDIGQVASVAEGLALAVLPIDAEYDELKLAGTVAQRVPFINGLAR
ncbi:folate-binding protein YgfZ [Xylella taiwanensis]|uniref:CAF17-like 4Fe-4S cluster assembly/insertion protein YgfZ n=1 Tax=Xylella taiwanensis TaxID=1444770 RepID=UPI000571DC07|nr:folate-binding protein YgfZ [Xylella taiwanensis]AXI82861.1 aminomethyltransferase [Xylella taiwanensis]NBI37253.1 folate-binding protein YgfZ [Xylella taiwanensis]QKD99469.1 folate-binding protein YgfZ [Xylella taiwanensis]